MKEPPPDRSESAFEVTSLLGGGLAGGPPRCWSSSAERLLLTLKVWGLAPGLDASAAAISSAAFDAADVAVVVDIAVGGGGRGMVPITGEEIMGGIITPHLVAPDDDEEEASP